MLEILTSSCSWLALWRPDSMSQYASNMNAVGHVLDMEL